MLNEMSANIETKSVHKVEWKEKPKPKPPTTPSLIPSLIGDSHFLSYISITFFSAHNAATVLMPPTASVAS
jgi:hypothetical protein